MIDRIWSMRVDRRFMGLAVFAVFITVLYTNRTRWHEFVGDWDGLTGLTLAAIIGMLAPRGWQALTFTAIAAYFVAVGLEWLLLDLQGQSKSSSYWIGLFAAACITVVCAWLTKRQDQGANAPSEGVGK